jgi:hypothetical protein
MLAMSEIKGDGYVLCMNFEAAISAHRAPTNPC